jgi:hypothetical protein
MGKYLSEDLTCYLCSNLSNDGEKSLHHPSLIPLSCISNEHITNVNALIDTGAFQSNVSKTIAKLLKARGARKDNKKVKICSGICGVCAQTNEVIYFDIKLLNQINNNYISFHTSAFVIDLKYDLVIGISDIKNHNLLLLNYKHFEIYLEPLLL